MLKMSGIHYDIFILKGDIHELKIMLGLLLLEKGNRHNFPYSSC